ADSAGNALLPFASSFTTAAPDTGAFDPGAVQVSFPDEEGNVTVSAEAGSFEPGASLTIVNVTNGMVVTGDVAPDGGFEITLRASVSDELQIRILDGAGREIVIEKTEYRAADGRVAIGTKGGSVSAGEFGLDVPEGALPAAAIFRLTPLTPEEIADLPLPEGAGGIGSGVRVDTGGAVLEAEADLTFPAPAEAPLDALFLVFRTVDLAGELLYEVVDTASLENGKVTTNSAPFPGVLKGGDYTLSWYPLQPGQPRAEMGVVVGIAQETGGTAAQPKATPLGGVEVRLDKPPVRGDYVAYTLANGRFAMIDVAFGSSGTTVRLTGKAPDGRLAVATAFEGTGSQPGVSAKFNRTGEAVLNFAPAAPEPPRGRIGIRLLKGASREPIPGGFVPVNEEILFAMEFSEKPAQVFADVSGVSREVVSIDDVHFEARFTPTEPRSYTLHVTGIDAHLREIFSDLSFLAVLGGSGNDESVSGPPSILTDESFPKSGATAVDVHPLFTVTFSEPVVNVTGENVRLQPAGGTASVPLELVGRGPGFGPAVPETDSQIN
ncbi:MAG TPA: hypothetical protein VIG29_08170, partial [Vicinamibacteria bacterium]